MTGHLALLAIPLVSAIASGCMQPLATARTIDQGRLQATVGFGERASFPVRGANAMGQLDVGLRYGIADRLEIGVMAMALPPVHLGALDPRPEWFFQGAIDAKIAIVRPPSAESGLNVSIDPGVGYVPWAATEGRGITATLPLLWGLRFGSGHEVTLGPRVVDTYQSFTSTSSEHRVFVGSSIGMSFKLTETVRLLFDVAVLKQVVDTRWQPGMYASDSLSVSTGSGFTFGRETSGSK